MSQVPSPTNDTTRQPRARKSHSNPKTQLVPEEFKILIIDAYQGDIFLLKRFCPYLPDVTSTTYIHVLLSNAPTELARRAKEISKYALENFLENFLEDR